jgi:hypothetical protein
MHRQSVNPSQHHILMGSCNSMENFPGTLLIEVHNTSKGHYMEHFQPRGWTQPCLPGWNFSPVCNTKLYQSQTCDYMTKFSTQGWNYYELFEHACMAVTIYFKKTKLFYFRESMPRTYIIPFQPRGWNRPCNRKKFQPG